MSATRQIIDKLKARNTDIDNSMRHDSHGALTGSSLGSPTRLWGEQSENKEKIARLERATGSHGTF